MAEQLKPHTARASDDFCLDPGRPLTAPPCHARYRSMMAKFPGVWGRSSLTVPYARQHGRCCRFERHRAQHRLLMIATLIFVAAGAGAHEPEGEFTDWFRSPKQPRTGEAMGKQHLKLLTGERLPNDPLRDGSRRQLLDHQ